MIIVNLKSAGFQSSSLSQERTSYYVSGMVNWHFSGNPKFWRPPTDVYETEEKFIVRVEIAGMRDEDFSLNFDHHTLAISGTRPEIIEKRAFHQMEIFFGEFNTSIEILSPIDVENITAEYQDGFLKVFLPKTLAKHINIKDEL